MRRNTIITIILLFMGVFQMYAQVREIDANVFFYTLLPKMTKPIVIDFWAEWCGPCRRFAPTFLSVAREYKSKADFYRVNVDNNEEWCKQWEIESIPTTIVIYNKNCDAIRNEGVLNNNELRRMIKDGIVKNKKDDELYF